MLFYLGGILLSIFSGNLDAVFWGKRIGADMGNLDIGCDIPPEKGGLGTSAVTSNLFVALKLIAVFNVKIDPKYVCWMTGNFDNISALYIFTSPV